MKKVMVITMVVITGIFLWNYLFFYKGILYIPNHNEVIYHSKAEGKNLYVDYGMGFEEIEIRGVNLGFGKPGYYATEGAITKEEYLRWFEQIQELGANVVRIYKKAPVTFYDAFYEYNQNRSKPLFLLQGVAIDDYLMNSIYGAQDDEFKTPFIKDCKIVVDVIHGRYKEKNPNGGMPIYYDKDISKWVYGYILGGEWETRLVMYTNNYIEQLPQYEGKYLYTTDAENFEIFLCEIGDEVISYETDKYGMQKVLAFTNWTFSDPLEYDEDLVKYFKNIASIDVEKIKRKETFSTGLFAAYHVYPEYPDFFRFKEEHEENTYREYLTELQKHHSIPVVIAEFGASSSRAMTSPIEFYNSSQGRMNEKEQGEAIITMYQDIIQSGCNGGIVSNWQDEWYKKTWNVVANINVDSMVYWSDFQSCKQSYGLLSFEPGEEKSICYVDGTTDDWQETELLSEDNDVSLYMKYDEKFIYFMLRKPGYQLDKDKLYVALNTTPKSGTKVAENLNIQMNDPADFVIEISGKEDSRVWVQERYNTLSALFADEISNQNFFSKEFPAVDSQKFVKINMLLQNELFYEAQEVGVMDETVDKRIAFSEFSAENPYHYRVTGSYETGLLTYGNANPEAEDYNSLADFCVGDGVVELKIPWQLLNFADPIKMYIHDDYYEKYGVEYLKIDSITVGAGDGTEEIIMSPFNLDGLSKEPNYHERMKESYYILQNYWLYGVEEEK